MPEGEDHVTSPMIRQAVSSILSQCRKRENPHFKKCVAFKAQNCSSANAPRRQSHELSPGVCSFHDFGRRGEKSTELRHIHCSGCCLCARSFEYVANAASLSLKTVRSVANIRFILETV
jgi:hypothetical protein